MPTRDLHMQFEKWAREYGRMTNSHASLLWYTDNASVGDVYSLILGTQTWVVLSSDTAIKDLLDKRSAIYSSRLEHYIGQELCSGGLRMLMMVSK
jgi:hypothetical protein